MDNLISNDRQKNQGFKYVVYFSLGFAFVVTLILTLSLEFNFFWTFLVSAVSCFLISLGAYNVACDRTFCANGLVKAIKAIYTRGGETWAYLWYPYLGFTFFFPVIYMLSIILLSPIDYIIVTKKERNEK